jgi:8-oxo-dGTP diphosphatase
MSLPYRIATLIYLHNPQRELLLLQRKCPPNVGLWSPVGGKLKTELGESPLECALRETREETGWVLQPDDLHLFAYISESAYQNQSHWLIFLYHCLKPLACLPPDMEEGHFAFHSPQALENLPIPDSDRRWLWPLYFKHRHGFCGIRLTPSTQTALNPGGPDHEATVECGPWQIAPSS